MHPYNPMSGHSEANWSRTVHMETHDADGQRNTLCTGHTPVFWTTEDEADVDCLACVWEIGRIAGGKRVGAIQAYSDAGEFASLPPAPVNPYLKA